MAQCAWLRQRCLPNETPFCVRVTVEAALRRIVVRCTGRYVRERQSTDHYRDWTLVHVLHMSFYHLPIQLLDFSTTLRFVRATDGAGNTEYADLEVRSASLDEVPRPW